MQVILFSQRRQRRSFSYAGVLNFVSAPYFIASHYHWFDRPAWAIALIGGRVAALGAGFLLHRRERLTRF